MFSKWWAELKRDVNFYIFLEPTPEEQIAFGDRPKTISELDLADYQELNRLLIKAGRRCAYDLMHAHAGQEVPELSRMYYARANYWLGIFNPDTHGTEYRDDLHMRINDLRRTLEQKTAAYRELLEKHGIEDTVSPHDDCEPPF